MYCENRITHRVQEGDSLYSLSRKYHTTETELILLNSGVNPYNLQVGMRLIVCPGEGYEEEKKEGSVIVLPIRPPKPQKPGMNNGSNAENSVEEMKNQMRLDWLNHIISVKFYLVSFLKTWQARMRGSMPWGRIWIRFYRFLKRGFQQIRCGGCAVSWSSICS